MANELVLENGVWKLREATASGGEDTCGFLLSENIQGSLWSNTYDSSNPDYHVGRYGLTASFSTFNTSSFIDTNIIQASRANELYELEEIN
jgi:hypothetical protein